MFGALAGCHSPGPGHVYAWTPAAPQSVLDLATDASAPSTALPGRVAPGEYVVGIAYDFNTDFLILRVEPYRRIRICKRGENRYVREWMLPAELALPADLAVRPRDRHLFAAHLLQPELWEFSLEGNFLRVLALTPQPPAPLRGLAFDHTRDRFVALLTTTPAQLIEIAPDGTWTTLAPLAAEVVAVTLGCNGETGEYYALLAGGGIGVFDRRGALLRRLAGADATTALDAGPRSLVRVF
ncbi:MAG: hypothetical protein HZA31_08290 [Opitutae bacterium]|nr:hypothetical protein [Opitutae bacterium]